MVQTCLLAEWPWLEKNYKFITQVITDDLNSKRFLWYSSHDLNTVGIWITNIWITNFHLFSIQMSGIQMVVRYSNHHLNTGPVFKWWSEYQTKFSPVFKWHSNNRPFGDRTTFPTVPTFHNWMCWDYLNVKHVRYQDPNWNLGPHKLKLYDRHKKGCTHNEV